MRSLTREEAIRLCESFSVVVEFSIQGYRANQPFTPSSRFYRADAPYDFSGVRYFLANGSAPISSGGSGGGAGSGKPSQAASAGAAGEGGNGNGGKEEWVEDSGEEEAQEQASPPGSQPISQPGKKAEAKAKDKAVTVKVLAEDGKSAAPKGILPDKGVKLKAVPSEGAGTYAWTTKSVGLKLEGAGTQTVTLTFEKGKAETQGGEVVELVFTPTGKPALAPVAHTLSVVKVLIMKDDAHPWGYDEYSEIAAKDHNGSKFAFTPDSKLDLVSVQKGKTGLVDVHYSGSEGASLHFKVLNESLCKAKPKNAKANPIVLELEAKSGKYAETRLEVRHGAADGPVVAEINLVVLTAVKYKARYFRVEDPGSQGTKLQVAATPAEFEKALKRIYKGGVAEWKIEGKAEAVKSKYDVIKNGALDLEPGVDSEELKQLKKDCVYKGTRVIHVHALRWSYFLAADAKATDTKITLKNYGGYLDFVGTNTYTLEDTAGHKIQVKIKSADRTKAEFELAAPLGVDLKTSDKAALLWPLGGLSGDPTLVSDFGGHATLVGIVAHELGHSNAGLKDTSEIVNIMHGVAEGNEGTRGRDIPLFYHKDQKEKQWSVMPGRN